MEIIRTAAALMVRSMVLSAQSADQLRLLHLRWAAGVGGDVGETVRLREENRRLQAENQLLKSRFGQTSPKKRYTPMQRLQILWHMAYYRIPRSRVKEHFLIARSTLYRWLHAAEEGNLGGPKADRESPRKTPQEIAQMIWEIFEANPHFGRKRLASILWLLGVFVASSTVRNVLLRPRPTSAPAAARAAVDPRRSREIVSRYPNHVWSVDRTRVWRWGVWPTWVLVAIDHYSRMITAVCPLEGPNAGWVVGALEEAFLRHEPPKHLITDQEGVFVSRACRGLLRWWNVKQRFGAVGRHGSIAVTERAILTLKYEWLRRVPVIRDLAHLSRLLQDFELYYNSYRGHSRLGGAVPQVLHCGKQWGRPPKSAKTVPSKVERRIFPDTGITAYRLAA